MPNSTTDPLERAALSGALFAGPDPDGREPRSSGRPSSDGGDSHNGDEDDKGLLDDGHGSDGEVGFVHPSEASTAAPASDTMRRGQSHNTGVKGVLADFRQQQREQQSRNEKHLEKQGLNGRHTTSSRTDANHVGADDLDISDDEAAAINAYRQRRLEEMKLMGSGERASVAQELNGPLKQNKHAPRFGHLREVGQQGFIRAVEEGAGVYVVVHVYDPSIPACNTLNHHLTSLARAYPLVKFIRTLAVDIEFATGDERDVLPTILIYKDGENVNSLIAVHRELGAGREVDDDDDDVITSAITREKVELLFLRHGIISRNNSMHANATLLDDDSE